MPGRIYLHLCPRMPSSKRPVKPQSSGLPAFWSRFCFSLALRAMARLHSLSLHFHVRMKGSWTNQVASQAGKRKGLGIGEETEPTQPPWLSGPFHPGSRVRPRVSAPWRLREISAIHACVPPTYTKCTHVYTQTRTHTPVSAHHTLHHTTTAQCRRASGTS